MSNLNRLKVVDFTCGRYDSDDVNTDIPFTESFEKTRTIQQANVVLAAYMNRNYQQLENKANRDEIPTMTSQLYNDSGYITEADVPTKTSELDNDSGFITADDVPTKTSELDNDSGFITNDVNDLTNYTTTTDLNVALSTINGDITSLTTKMNNLSDPIELLNYTPITQGNEYTLSDVITNYRYLIVQLSTASNEANSNKQYIPTQLITSYDNKCRVAISLFQSTSVYMFGDFYFSASNKIYCNTYTRGSWNAQLKVWGIK